MKKNLVTGLEIRFSIIVMSILWTIRSTVYVTCSQRVFIPKTITFIHSQWWIPFHGRLHAETIKEITNQIWYYIYWSKTLCRNRNFTFPLSMVISFYITIFIANNINLITEKIRVVTFRWVAAFVVNFIMKKFSNCEEWIVYRIIWSF